MAAIDRQIAALIEMHAALEWRDIMGSLPGLSVPLKLCLFMAGWMSAAALAQGAANYPSKTVRIVLPFAPGAVTDVETRLYAQKLTENTGKAFVVDYKPGAGQTIGVGYTAKAAPDGYTILIISSGFTVNPAFYKNLPYDPIKDFAPVSLMTKRPTVLMVNLAVPATNVKEWLAYAKANPGKVNYGTSGAGGMPHLAGAWLHSATNTPMTFVHYQGSAGAQQDLLAGRIQMMAATFLSAMPMIKSGKLRALATASSERSSLLPNLPTIAEQVLPGFDYSSWLGVLAPAKTPPAIVNKLSAELAKVAKDPEIERKLSSDGTMMIGSTPEFLRQLIVTEINRWEKLVQETGIKLEE